MSIMHSMNKFCAACCTYVYIYSIHKNYIPMQALDIVYNVAIQNNLPPSTCKRPCLSAYGSSDIDFQGKNDCWLWEERKMDGRKQAFRWSGWWQWWWWWEYICEYTMVGLEPNFLFDGVAGYYVPKAKTSQWLGGWWDG